MNKVTMTIQEAHAAEEYAYDLGRRAGSRNLTFAWSIAAIATAAHLISILH